MFLVLSLRIRNVVFIVLECRKDISFLFEYFFCFCSLLQKESPHAVSSHVSVKTHTEHRTRNECIKYRRLS